MVIFILVFSVSVFGLPNEKLAGGLSEGGLSASEVNTFLVKPSSFADVQNLESVLRSLDADFSFKRVGKVFVVKVSSLKILDLIESPFVSKVWPDLEVFSVDEQALSQVNVHAAWDLNYFGDGKKIAVLDSGIDASHPVFQDRIIAAQNFSVSPTVTDLLGHGTHVAGIAAGFGDVNGVAPHAFLLNGKVLDDSGHGFFSSVIDGINWAVEQDADVINLSLGGLSHETNTPLNQAVRDAMEQGVVVVIASGNCGEICPSSSCNGFVGVTLPGNTKEAVTVGSVNSENEHACFSSGENISGVGIKPDLAAPGVSILSSLPSNGQGVKSGTSMSTPFVAGAAALFMQAHQQFSSHEIKALLENTALDLGEAGKDVLFGSGLLDLTQIESTDVNVNDDSNDNNSVNNDGNQSGFGSQFFFSGPEELMKNNAGEYQMSFLGGGSIDEEISGHDFNGVDTVVEFIILDELQNIIDYNVVGPLELSIGDIGEDTFKHFFLPQRTGSFIVKANIYQQGELFDGAIGSDGNIFSFSAQKNVKVTLSQNTLEVTPVSIPSTVDKGEEFAAEVFVRNLSDFDTNAFVEIIFLNDQNSIAEVFSSSSREVKSGLFEVFEITNEIFIPSGDYNAIVNVHFENQKISLPQQVRVELDTSLLIDSFFVTPVALINSNQSISVVLYNNSSMQLQPTVIVRILDENKVVKSFFDANTLLAPFGGKDVLFDWSVTEPAKTYLLELQVMSEGSVAFEYRQVQVIDNVPPVNFFVDFTQAQQNGLVEVNAKFSDYSKISSVVLLVDGQEFLMKKTSTDELGQEFVGVITQTTQVGLKEFSVRACDEFSNCSNANSFVFIQPLPGECNNNLALLVIDNDKINALPSQQSENISLPGCFAKWNTKDYGRPSLALLKRFRPVFWFSGNYFGGVIDSNETQILSQFVNSSGSRLFIEGSDVSSEHSFDDFSRNVLHAEFKREVGQDQNFLAAPLNFFGGTQSPFGFQSLDLNFAYAPYADAVKPVNNGVSFAGWDQNNSGVVGWKNNCTRAKTLFASFGLSALSGSDRNSFLSSAYNWLNSFPNGLCPKHVVNQVENDLDYSFGGP